MWRFFPAVLWFGLIGTVFAQGKPEVIIDRAQVEVAMARGALLWDIRGTREFLQGHIPGALSIGDAASVLRDANREDFISVAAIEQVPGGFRY